MAGGNEVVAGYGKAVVAVAEAEGQLERVADELFRLGRAIEANSELSDELSNPAVSSVARVELIERLLSGKSHPATTASALLVVQSGRARLLPEIADETARLSAQSRARALAEVRSAVPLDEAQQTRLAAALSEATGREVDLKVIVDENVVGGLVAKVGDTVIDGSIARRLTEVRTRLTG